jgi:tRNA threonylcarbamoyladenosine biosynthesis protein TsaE
MTTAVVEWRSLDEPALVALARRLAPALRDGGVVFLVGDLGAGKTTFARALLQALGIPARIKSPTYSLIESYRTADIAVHHLDLYRIADPGELEWLGLADLTAEPHLLVVEWPERAGGALPVADLVVRLQHAGATRHVRLEAASARGAAWLANASLVSVQNPPDPSQLPDTR